MISEKPDYLDEIVALRARTEPQIAGKWAAVKIVMELRRVREEKGISQAQIAETLGLSQSHIARLERTP